MSVVGKQGYQESDAGWIPDDWSALSLGSVASVRKGKGIAKQGVRCIELEHIEPESGRLIGWDDSGVQASIKTAFSKGDVLFGKLRPYLRKYAVAPFDGICTTEILAIHPQEKATDSNFLFHLMQGDGVFSTVEALSYGTKMPRVSWADLSEIIVGIPPIPEQGKIAAILTTVDDKLNVISSQIETTRALKQGLMQTLFRRGVGTQAADGRWVPHTDFKDSELGEIPTSWSEQKASEICDVRDGTHDSPKFHEYGVPFYTSKNISDGKLTSKGAKLISLADAEKFNKRSKVHRGDILMSMIGTVGEAALVNVEPDFCIKNVGMFKPNNSVVSSRYLLYFFQSLAFKAFVKTQLDGGIQKFLSLTALRALKVPLPPLQEQNEIANFLDVVTQKFELLEARQTHFITLKCGLMQKLLTGECRVTLDVHQDTAIAA